MINDSLFIQTKQQIIHWKKHKKFKGQKIPNDIKENIKILVEKYSRPQVGKGLDLSPSTIATFMKIDGKNKIQNTKKIQSSVKVKNDFNPNNIFHQFPNKISEVKKQLLRLEIEIPGRFTLRLFQ